MTMTKEGSRMKIAAAEEFEAPAERAATWFALRVDPRRTSVGNAQLSMVRRSARPAVPVDGASGAPEPHHPNRAEFLVQEILLRAGIDAWVPVRSKWVRSNKYRRHEKRVVYQPILPGYVLAAPLASADGKAVSWARVLRCPMVRGVMGFGGAPAAIPQREIGRLHDVEHEDQARTIQRLMPTGRAFKVGEAVEVLEGPLGWSRGKVIEITPTEAKVIFEMFGSERPVRVDLANLGSVESAI
ncbi:transcription termination/antitermination protein NusG [Amaricoccus solimangrovi]|uniref:NusG-like N-terminal domain-containing protein n=1 Tax=Amaricoccus solimangrovi TaxID=2589815 RepID=A0A501WCA8_9RHOB|nr:transcription termination/antitermination NusG family protein [Amaricoccus solimangrovi]TPE47239.1 hypothetical protein FJM51_20510 [Amaricoccus solimangrovi]